MSKHVPPPHGQSEALAALFDFRPALQLGAPRDPVRAALEAHVERCIAMLDALDGDPDLEDGADVERDPAEAGVGDLDGMWEQGHLAGRGLEART